MLKEAGGPTQMPCAGVHLSLDLALENKRTYRQMHELEGMSLTAQRFIQ